MGETNERNYNVIMNDEPEFLKSEYWAPHFDDNCKLSIRYHSLSDNSKILSVLSKPEVKSNKKPLILISGWFSVVYRWSEVLKIVSKEIEVVYIETRDKISSIIEKSKKTDMSVERMVQDIIEIQEDLGVDFNDSICLGSSMGATILLKYLTDRNPAPWKTILIGPVPKFNFPIIGRFLMILPTFMIGFGIKYIRWHVRNFRVDTKKEPKQAKSYDLALKLADPWRIQNSARAAKKHDGWKELGNIDSEVIFAGASTDKIHASEITQQVASKIKNSKYVDFKTNQATHDEKMANFIIKLAQGTEIYNLEDLID